MSPARERGSIVIEAMIAVLIVAAMAGALFQTIASRAAAARGVAARREALLVAQSRLAAVDLDAGAVPGVTRGVDGALVWRVEAEPFHADETSAAGTLALVTVAVGAAARPGRPLATLRTLRLVR